MCRSKVQSLATFTLWINIATFILGINVFLFLVSAIFVLGTHLDKRAEVIARVIALIHLWGSVGFIA